MFYSCCACVKTYPPPHQSPPPSPSHSHHAQYMVRWKQSHHHRTQREKLEYLQLSSSIIIMFQIHSVTTWRNRQNCALLKVRSRHQVNGDPMHHDNWRIGSWNQSIIYSTSAVRLEKSPVQRPSWSLSVPSQKKHTSPYDLLDFGTCSPLLSLPPLPSTHSNVK